MNDVTAKAGWDWVRQGFRLFRQQPLEMLSLFFAYMFFNMVLGFIPVIGQFLPFVLIPVFSLSFMEACRRIECGQRVLPGLFLSGFRSPALPRLLLLGVLYVVAISLAVFASNLTDDGVFWEFITSQKPLDPKTMSETGLFLGMMTSAIAYIPAMMAFWYAAVLIAWKNMSVAKAIFFSFFAVHRAGMAFMVYGLGWVAVGILVPAMISILIAVIVGKAYAIVFAMMPVSIILSVAMYCSFYPTYTDVFGKPDENDQSAA
ncbi:BPSS1780 family membrane protein [Undibacterium sp. TS12]|uniref:BPSS1780 family membrane protein n=1 Tax=Undibacterium sp. TS12 TaxID=2908202 RepID=UPI001F4C7A93|nr:BPSS1780 family membrane protein [Undibacterium sp. TS12]MCH8620110.1 hypothetical protein [Undibacterium sp. TS12]